MDAAAYKTKGNDAFSAKNFPEAIENFTKAIELDGSNHVLWSNRSASYASLQQWEKAKSDAERCVELNGTWAKGYLRLGSALHGLKQFERAIEVFNKGLELEPANESLKQALAAVEKDKARATNPFAKIFNESTYARIQANPKLAPFLQQPDFVQMLNQIIANPGMFQMFLKDNRMMQVFIELSGIQIPQEGEEDEPKPKPRPKPEPSKPKEEPKATSSEAQKIKEQGNELYKKREFDAALAKYKEAFEMEPTNTTFLLNCTAVYFEQGQFEVCHDECVKALEHCRENKGGYVTLTKLMTRQALCLQRLRRHEEALPIFKQALLEHRNPDTLKKMQECEKEMQRLAEEAYLNPELAKEEKEKGNEFFKLDKFPEAVQCYTESIKRNPAEHTTYSNRAAAYLKLGAYEDAIKDCDKCLEIKPDFVKAISRKASAYFWTKQYHKALQFYEEGLKIDPKHAECLEGRQRTMQKISEVAHGQAGDEDEVARRAMSDPEVQNILQDSYMQLILKEMQMNPQRIKDYMQDPAIAAKLNRLVSAGILRFGGPAQ